MIYPLRLSRGRVSDNTLPRSSVVPLFANRTVNISPQQIESAKNLLSLFRGFNGYLEIKESNNIYSAPLLSHCVQTNSFCVKSKLVLKAIYLQNRRRVASSNSFNRCVRFHRVR